MHLHPRAAFLVAGLAASSPLLIAASTLIEPGQASVWRFLDDDRRPPAGWAQPHFDDTAWRAGPAPLGFGEPDVVTPVRPGPDPAAKAPATYFRHAFDVEAPGRWSQLAVFARVDDGAVIYLNGREVARLNLPEGRIQHTTTADEAVGGEAEQVYYLRTFPASLLVPGRNVIAVEVHQGDAVSSDLFLDLKLRAYAADEEPTAGDTPVPAGASSDPATAALLAVRGGDFARARELLERLPVEHPRFQFTMLQAVKAFAAAGQPEAGLPWAERAYRHAPDAQETAYGWARTQLLARTNLHVVPQPRPRLAEVPEQWRWLVDGPRYPDRSKRFARRELEADLDFLEAMIANGYSYAERRGADWRGALDAVRASLDEETGVTTFALRLQRFLTIFGDPHSYLRTGYHGPRGILPFVPVPDSSSRVLAVRADRSGFFDAARPYVRAMDGVPIEEWLRVAGRDVPQASPQYQRRAGVEALNWLDYLRGELQLPIGPQVRVTLTSEDGTTTRHTTIAVAPGRTSTPRLPADTHFIRDGIGYLRIGSMRHEEAFIAGLNRAMQDFRRTSGLIIDVRGNGGGTQDTVRTLMPYFLPPGGPLKIVNVAKYRVPVKFAGEPREGFLPAGRHLHPVTSSVWTDAERAEIRSFLETFTPNWQPSAGVFSAWHVMGIRHETNPRAYFYNRPVVVLCDAGSFSATDNFLGALKGLPNVTLLGATSGGGSGRMGDYTLPHTRLAFTLCQMISFRANGELYEGAGVPPDIVMHPKPTDHLIPGGDSVLEAAFARLTPAPRQTAAARERRP